MNGTRINNVSSKFAGRRARRRRPKSGVWQTSYHEIEHGLLNYLYLSLYVNQRPEVLHFKLDGPGKHFVSLADDASVRIGGVRINGELWADFDGRERSVALPDGKGLEVAVTLIS